MFSLQWCLALEQSERAGRKLSFCGQVSGPVAAVSRFLSRGSRDLWLSLETFPRGFPTGLSHEAFPRGFPTRLSHRAVPRATVV